MSSIRLKKNIVERKRKSLIRISILAAVLLILYLASLLSIDRTAPVFDFTDAASVYNLSDTDNINSEIFLRGVTASDNVDGDLSGKIVVKAMRKNADASISVTYCVRDHSGNLATEERIYNISSDVSALPEDRETTGSEEGSSGDASSSTEDASSSSQAENEATSSSEDVAASSAEASSEETTQPVESSSEETLPPIETDTQAEPPAESSSKSEVPYIILNCTEAHVPVGSRFNYPMYIAEMWDDVDSQDYLYQSIWIENYELVDWNTPGVYTLIFRIVDSDKNISEGKPLTVYVE